MRVVAFYTEGTPYEELANNCAASASEHGIVLHLFKRPDMGCWGENCAHKPGVLIEALEKWDERILYVDVDATFEGSVQPLEDLPADFDIGFHLLGGLETLSGTILLEPTGKTLEVLLLWQKWAKARPKTWDQRHLAAVIDHLKPRVHELGPEWAYIFDTSKRFHPDVEPVILHHQASRKYRRWPYKKNGEAFA